MLVDTHCHLDEAAFDPDRSETIARARDAGVAAMLSIGIDVATSEAAVALASEHDDVFAVVGVQPNYVTQVYDDAKDRIRSLATQDKVVAIGETGLDLYWDYAPLEEQQPWFDWHLDLAREVGKPFIVHCRDAEEQVVEQLRRYAGGQSLSGVMHSFCGSRETAAACLEMGLHLSFSGMLTYKRNDELRQIAAEAPADRVLVETDAPYLAPVPKRGKRNEPALVAHTAAVLAECRGLTADEAEALTTANAAALFGLPIAGASPA